MDVIRKRARSLAVLAAAVAALVVAGCGGGESGDSTGGSANADGPKPVLRLGLTSSGLTLDPGRDATGAQTPMRMLAYEPLIRLEPDGSYSPALATSWRYVGSGNRVFELKLRRGVTFSDGAPLDAAAVRAWIEYFARFSSLSANLGTVERVEEVDSHTARIHLASGNPELPYLLSDQYPAGAIVSPKALARPRSLGTTTAGAGQYVLDSSRSVANDHYSFVPNPRYYDTSAIRFGRVDVKVITNPSSMLQAATTGQLDVADGDVSTADSAEQAGLHVESALGQFSGIFFGDLTGRIVPALGDVRVRQAINYAIDRDAIAKALLGRYGAPTSEILTSDGFDESYKDHYAYDPEKARALLAEAGYADGFTMSVVAQGFNGNVGEPVAQAVAEYLGRVGITLRITTPPTDGEWGSLALSGRYPLLQANFESFPMWVAYSTLLAPNSVANFFHARSPQLQAAYDAATVAADPEPRWKEMSRIATDQALVLPVVQASFVWFVDDKVDGVELSTDAFRPNPTTWSPK